MIEKMKQRSLPQWLTLFVLAMPFALFFFTELLHFPPHIYLTIDLAWAGSFLFFFREKEALLHGSRQVKIMFAAGILFFLTTLAGFVLQYQSVLYYLWGLRNNARFFVFFFACIFFLKGKDREQGLKLLDILFWVNFAVTLYQFFVMDVTKVTMGGDLLGGIFGVQRGCNAYTNIFLMIVVTLSVVGYLNQREAAVACLAKCAVSLAIAAMAELKMFLIEFALIIVLAILLTQFTKKKILLMVCAGVGLVVSVQLLIRLFPSWAGWFNFENLWKTATSEKGYSGVGDMNRLTAIPIAWNGYLDTWTQKLFGLGLGNCDYAPVDFFTTPFYLANEGLHYTWLSSGFLMLETGAVGVVLYLAFFVVIFFCAHSLERSGKAKAEFCQSTKILAMMCWVLFLYNNSLRNEAAYMLYFAMSLPFIGLTQQEK